MIVKSGSLLGGHGKARCTVIDVQRFHFQFVDLLHLFSFLLVKLSERIELLAVDRV